MVKDKNIDEHFESAYNHELTEGEKFPAIFISCTTLKDPVSFNGKYHNFEIVSYVDYHKIPKLKGINDYHCKEYLDFKEKITNKFLNSILVHDSF